MAALDLIEFIFAIIGFISSILTVISYFFPNSSYPFTNWIRNVLNKRLLAKQSVTVILYKNYCYNDENLEVLLESMKEKFSKFNLLLQDEGGYINGGLIRQNFNINLTIDNPIINEGSFIFKQKVTVKFKELYKLLNVLFDVYRDFEVIDSVEKYDDKV